jgi:hypothetical protein
MVEFTNEDLSGARFERVNLTGTGEHAPPQHVLDGEGDIIGHARPLKPLPVLSPHLRQVQFAVDQRPAGVGGVGQKHRDLRVLDPPGRARVLALDTDAEVALLDVARVVQDQYPTRIAELVDHELAQVVTDLVSVPHRLTQQPPM